MIHDHSTTVQQRRSTTLPIELISDQRDMSVADYKNAQIPSLERKQGKGRITSLKLCNMKLDYISRLIGVNTYAGTVPKTLIETRQNKKETTKIQRCSEPRVQKMSTAVDQTATIPRTRESSRDPGEQHIVTRKNVCSRQKLPPTCNVRCTQVRHENNVQQRRRKHDQREILESRDIRQVPNRRRVEVQSQNRELLIRDVCTCLAHWGDAIDG